MTEDMMKAIYFARYGEPTRFASMASVLDRIPSEVFATQEFYEPISTASWERYHRGNGTIDTHWSESRQISRLTQRKPR